MVVPCGSDPPAQTPSDSDNFRRTREQKSSETAASSRWKELLPWFGTLWVLETKLFQLKVFLNKHTWRFRRDVANV